MSAKNKKYYVLCVHFFLSSNYWLAKEKRWIGNSKFHRTEIGSGKLFHPIMINLSMACMCVCMYPGVHACVCLHSSVPERRHLSLALDSLRSVAINVTEFMKVRYIQNKAINSNHGSAGNAVPLCKPRDPHSIFRTHRRRRKPTPHSSFNSHTDTLSTHPPLQMHHSHTPIMIRNKEF